MSIGKSLEEKLKYIKEENDKIRNRLEDLIKHNEDDGRIVKLKDTLRINEILFKRLKKKMREEEKKERSIPVVMTKDGKIIKPKGLSHNDIHREVNLMIHNEMADIMKEEHEKRVGIIETLENVNNDDLINKVFTTGAFVIFISMYSLTITVGCVVGVLMEFGFIKCCAYTFFGICMYVTIMLWIVSLVSPLLEKHCASVKTLYIRECQGAIIVGMIGFIVSIMILTVINTIDPYDGHMQLIVMLMMGFSFITTHGCTGYIIYEGIQ